ncbi:MAG: lipoate--protein ligase [Tenericutes bacterium HGW-Tenericutes-1]|nr:MAG: lipoate--protein ligase [Tenericutes bacterium HGW-Tenericutes-1]
MKTIFSQSTNPYFNLAWEEYIFKHVQSEEDILLLWINEPSVIIGRNQNIFEEVCQNYTSLHHIPIIRRISGGGTVFHDLGNLNFSVMTNQYKDAISNYKYFTQPVVDCLKELGINATFSGKSDICINELKISGNAQSYHQNRMLHHGTLLFSSNLDQLNHIIKKTTHDIESFGVKSNRSNVTNILNALETPMSIDDFKEYLLKFWLKTDQPLAKALFLNDIDLEAINLLMETKYQTWDWNYGESPAFEIKKAMKQYMIHIKVDSGLIEDFIYFDGEIHHQMKNFIGIHFDKESYIDKVSHSGENFKKPLQSFSSLLFD